MSRGEPLLSKIVRTAMDVISYVIENSRPRASIDERSYRYSACSDKVPTAWRSVPEEKRERRCYECAAAHLGTAGALLRESLKRIERGPSEVVSDKVRAAFEELLGAEYDLLAADDDKARRLQEMIRDVRRKVYEELLVAGPTKESIEKAIEAVRSVSEELYEAVRAKRGSEASSASRGQQEGPRASAERKEGGPKQSPFYKYKDKLLIVVHPRCSACASLKSELEVNDKIKEDVVFLDVTKDEEAKVLAEAFDLRAFPSFFSVVEDGGKIKVCLLDDEAKKVERCMEVEHEE